MVALTSRIPFAPRLILPNRPTSYRLPENPETIAIDTECTGLFIHKGCRAFTISTCSSIDKKIRLWKFKVNPLDRSVKYNINLMQDLVRYIYKHHQVVFHNANFDCQALAACGIPWDWFFINFDVHDTMVMSHAYKSSNRHGLKENAILLVGYPDDDERLLSEITKAARREAVKLGWCTADKNNLHFTIEGTQKEHFRCDYWIPEQLAEHNGLPEGHEWRTICNEYAGKDAERTLCIHSVLEEMLYMEPNVSGFATYNHYRKDISTGTLYDKYNEARQLIWPILDMEAVGIPVKPRALMESQQLFAARQKETLEHLSRLSGIQNFNPRSQQQLVHALFRVFKFKSVKNGKTGPSTDKDVVSKLLSEAEIIDDRLPDRFQFLLQLKEFRKETATLQYLNNYELHSRPSALRPGPRRIQANFSQTRTGTGRLSCTDPNTTNVGKKDMSNPFADEKNSLNKLRATLFAEILGIDTDYRFSLRSVFGPLLGDQWTCIDFDQFQLRIFAIVSESYNLIEGFARGEDIHQLVAKIIFNKDDISDVERTAAKAINFGLLFGAGPEKIELLSGVPGLYSMFMSNFPKAKRYLESQSRLARTKGYVHTIGGYRLYVPYDAPHAASCYVIQGSEAEIVKRSMVNIHGYSKSVECPLTLLMMIHDELVFTSAKPTPETEYDYCYHLSRIMDIMEQSGSDIGVPCKVDAKITTTNWGDRQKLEFERLAV